MLKVVGASWLQTRISTYILIAVVILGFGAVVLSQFRVANDGTYAATALYNHRGGYKLEFWGQGNNLTTVSHGAARAYYKTQIHEVGWSTLEIETSPDYPDNIQARAAGLLEGSLTWQLIHHHWHNTIENTCEMEPEACKKIRERLRGNAKRAKSQAQDLGAADPFWHIIKLFYTQLDGLEEGWRYAVFRSRQEVDIPTEDFIWMAVANFRSSRESVGDIFVGDLSQGLSQRHLAILHNTVAPYTKMLRLLKKYTFGYHMTDARGAERVPTRAVVASSYPGALSSQDEYYLLYGAEEKDLMVVAGLPLLPKPNKTADELSESEIIASFIGMSAPRIMAANWLASDALTWSRVLGRRESPELTSGAFQWVIARANDSSLFLVEQVATETFVVDFSATLRRDGNLLFNGSPRIRATTLEPVEDRGSEANNAGLGAQQKVLLNDAELTNLTMKFMAASSELRAAATLRGDLESVPNASGVIDAKVSLLGATGLRIFEATSGPTWSEDVKAFSWLDVFPKLPHMGHPERFEFPCVSPTWIWY